MNFRFGVGPKKCIMDAARDAAEGDAMHHAPMLASIDPEADRQTRMEKKCGCPLAPAGFGALGHLRLLLLRIGYIAAAEHSNQDLSVMNLQSRFGGECAFKPTGQASSQLSCRH